MTITSVLENGGGAPQWLHASGCHSINQNMFGDNSYGQNPAHHPNTLDTQEFAYIPNISIEEILAAIQIALFHLHLIILSSKLTHKQHNLGWRSIVCRWMLDVLKVISSQLD